MKYLSNALLYTFVAVTIVSCAVGALVIACLVLASSTEFLAGLL
jgi:hypothetical protein